eukprot:Em0013g123a
MSQAVRINVVRCPGDNKGKVVPLGSSLEETLKITSDKFGAEIVELQSLKGAVIDDVHVLRDWDTIVAVMKDYTEGPASPERCAHEAGQPPHDSASEPADFVLRRTAYCLLPDAASRCDWVKLNVGGKVFATTRATLTSDRGSMLATMFEPGWSSITDGGGAYLIDRSPEYFEPLLNFLRHGKLIINEGVNPQGVLEEAKFFGISKAIEPLEALMQSEELSSSGHFTRKEFLRMLSSTSSASMLRCQGIDLENVDLSYFDLRNINFKCANLRGCNLSNCDLSNCVLERADLSNANLDGAIIQCVYMQRVNLEGATMRGCTMGERLGNITNMEGANLKGVLFDNSQMNGINLRLASLKGAFLRSCNLRYAIMAGTDLENCDLTGSDLQHANLRGSNLAGVIFDNIIAPLHMSQTVNVTVQAAPLTLPPQGPLPPPAPPPN